MLEHFERQTTKENVNLNPKSQSGYVMHTNLDFACLNILKDKQTKKNVDLNQTKSQSGYVMHCLP
jgi:hypothetical protein